MSDPRLERIRPIFGHVRSGRYSFEQWEQCRIDFVTGKGTLAWCAKKHGMKYHSVCHRAHKEQWTQQREHWFYEKKMREMVPQVAALINPPSYEGQGPPPPIQPLSPEFFLTFHNRYAQRLAAIDDELSEVFLRLKEDRTPGEHYRQLSIEDRALLMRVAKDYIDLTRTILGIPNVKPIDREAKIRRPRPASVIDLTPHAQVPQEGPQTLAQRST